MLQLSRLMVAGLVLALALSAQADTMSIRYLKLEVMSYQLKSVTIEGTVRDLKVFPPHLGAAGKKSCVVYGSYAFTLIDDTGEMEVQKVGGCLVVDAKPPIADGDVVTVVGQVQSFRVGESGASVDTIRIEAHNVVRTGHQEYR